MPTLILRPTGDGSLRECSIYPTTPTTHYDKVDEETPNDATDYVYASTTTIDAKRDTYTKPSTGLPSYATINSIKIYNRLYSPATPLGARPAGATLIRIGTQDFTGTMAYYTAWTTVSTTYTNNPATNQPWTVSDVEALEIGTILYVDEDGEGNRSGCQCSTVWLEIDYSINPVLTDVGVGSETAQILISVQDSGEGLDTLQASIPVAIADSGLGEDLATLSVGITALDAGLCEELAELPLCTVVIHDAGLSLEQVEVKDITLSIRLQVINEMLNVITKMMPLILVGTAVKAVAALTKPKPKTPKVEKPEATALEKKILKAAEKPRK
ncbi:MAG: hypothetical protein QW175_04655 [Candidatus Bathyarchaeia archaeon]